MRSEEDIRKMITIHKTYMSLNKHANQDTEHWGWVNALEWVLKEEE